MSVYYYIRNFLSILIAFGAMHAELFSQQFEDVAFSVGFEYCYGQDYFGGGISVLDFNRDGLDDLSVATGAGEECKFYINNGGLFMPTTWTIPDTQEHSGLLWVDFDNDEDYDLFITSFPGVNRLWMNVGNFNFIDVTEQAGFALDSASTAGSVWADLEGDGDLDVYVYNYHLDTFTNYLYRNNGDLTFTDITDDWGASDGYQLTLAAAFFDYDQDDNLDLFVANDARPHYVRNTMLRNVDNNSFEETSVESNMSERMSSMNAGIGDFDRDQDIDVYITNTFGPARLHQKHEDGPFFIDVAAGYEVENWGTGWGGNFFDYDNDMDYDLYVCNSDSSAATPNALYENSLPNPYFTQIHGDGRDKDTVWSNANAIFDYNMDGKCDIVVGNRCPRKCFIWENETNNSNNWIKIKLRGSVSNKDAIGSMIEVVADDITQIKFTQCGEAYIAQNSYQHHFGLGSNTLIDTIRVKFPSGIVIESTNIAVNQVVTVDEADGILTEKELSLFKVDNLLLEWIWTGGTSQGEIVLERSLNSRPFQQVASWESKEKGSYTVSEVIASQNADALYRMKYIIDGSIKQMSNTVRMQFQQPEIKLFPNPAEDLVYFYTHQDVLRLTMVSSEGKELKVPFTRHASRYELDVSAYPAGVYTLIIESNVAISQKRLILQ